ncbi:MAG: DM13 domain-containing protein [Saprospiraceae bacterium]|nr:DM13 domain-containing protein [Saprospiraceae bacterium]
MKPLKTLLMVASLLFVTTLALGQTNTQGAFQKLNYSVKGSWSLVEEDGQTYLELNETFSTQSGPDLKLFVTKTNLDRLNGSNAIQDAALISRLKRSNGIQRYLIPEGVDLSDYATLLIHCERFSKPWAGAKLN